MYSVNDFKDADDPIKALLAKAEEMKQRDLAYIEEQNKMINDKNKKRVSLAKELAKLTKISEKDILELLSSV